MATTWTTIVGSALQSTEMKSLGALLTSTEMTSQGALQTTVEPDDGCLRPAKKDPNDTNLTPWIYPHDNISEKMEFWISTVCNFGVIPFLFLIGGIGNILSAAVFYRQGLKIRINLCLFLLAISDVVTLAIIFLMHFEGSYRAHGGELNFFITYFLGFISFAWVSQFLSTVIASERCFCVVSPLKAQQVMSTGQMGLFIFVVSALLIGGLMLMFGNKYSMQCFTDPQYKVTYNILHLTKWYMSHQKAFDIVDVFVFSTVIPIFFLTVVTVTTVVTAVKLRQALAWRHQTVYAMSQSGKDTSEDKDQQQKPVSNTVKEAAVTKMLVATSVLFIVCIVPTIMLEIATFIEPEISSGGKYNNSSAVLWTLEKVFKCLNSSLNFPVYCFMGSKFRATLKEVVTCSQGTRSGSAVTGVSTVAKRWGKLA